MTGFIDKSDKLVKSCVYEDYGSGFNEDGFCTVQKDGKLGYIDRNNNVIIPFAYDDAYGVDNALVSVMKDG